MTDIDATSTEQTKTIRVASILDPYTLVINVGRKQGVTTNINFLVYGIGPEISDPETGENLGALEIVRGRGRVKHLQDTMCTISSSMVRKIPGLKKIYRRDRLSGLLGIGNQFDEVEEGSTTEDLPFEDPQVGDYVRPL